MDDDLENTRHQVAYLQGRHPARFGRQESGPACGNALQIKLPGDHCHSEANADDLAIPGKPSSSDSGTHLCSYGTPCIEDSLSALVRCSVGRRKNWGLKRWAKGEDAETKTQSSDGYVPLHPVLAHHLRVWQFQSPYVGAKDFVFPSIRAEGRVPLTAGVFVADHLRPAAIAAGVSIEKGQRFGLTTCVTR